MERLAAKDWLETVLRRERQCHQDFFGQEFNLTSFQKVLERYGLETISRWQELGLEPHFLPKVTISPDAEFLGGRVWIDRMYLFFVREGKIFRRQPDGAFTREKEPFALEGIIVLIETRVKPPFERQNSQGRGRQMFQNDNLLGPIIKQLSQEHKIGGRLVDDSSRFGLGTFDWEVKIKPVLADFLKVEISQVRLERFIEYLVIPRLYPHMPRSDEKDDGYTTVWLEEYYLKWPEMQIAAFFERYPKFSLERLFVRGFKPEDVQIDSHSSYDHYCHHAIRPLIVLDSELQVLNVPPFFGKLLQELPVLDKF